MKASSHAEKSVMVTQIGIGDMVCHVYHLLWIIAIAIFIFPSIITLS